MNRIIALFLLLSSIAFGNAVQGVPSSFGTTMPIGAVLPSNPSDGNSWHAMDGTVLPQASYPSLFAQLGHQPQFTFTLATGITAAMEAASNFSPASVSAVTYSSSLGLYAVVTNNSQGLIFTSPDLSTWTLRVNPAADVLNAVAWGSSIFVAAGNTGNLYTSTDGVTWTRDSTSFSGDGNITNLVFSNNRFVAFTSTGFVGYSTNGTSWTVSQPSASMNAGNCAVIYSSSLGSWIIAPIGGASAVSQGIIYSTNGTTWNFVARQSNQNWCFIGCDSSNFYMVDVLLGDVWRSPTGQTWTRSVVGIFPSAGSSGFVLGPSDGVSLIGAAYTGAGAFATSTNGGATISTSQLFPDTGTNPLLPSAALNTVPNSTILASRLLTGAPFFLSNGGNSFILASRDGVNWSPCNRYSITYGAATRCVGYANGFYFVKNTITGNSGHVWSAPSPYDPTVNFQLPIRKNADGSYQYIRTL